VYSREFTNKKIKGVKMEINEFEFELIGCLPSLIEECTIVEDTLINGIGISLQQTYNILLAKQKLAEDDYDIHAYNKRILELT
jgi:hypothetical protein